MRFSIVIRSWQTQEVRQKCLLQFPLRQFRSLVVPIALAVMASFALVLLTPPVVSGQEGAKEEVHFVGAHEIRVVPVNLNLGAGSAQYSAIVTNPKTGEPVPDARVVFLASFLASNEGEGKTRLGHRDQFPRCSRAI